MNKTCFRGPYIESPCGHGKLVDIVPHDLWGDESAGSDEQRRWGLITVVLRRGKDEPIECCSHMEGEFKTREEAEECCRLNLQHMDSKLNEALALLESLRRDVWSTARIDLEDLIALHGKLQEQRAEGYRTCDESLCFERAEHHWFEESGKGRDRCQLHQQLSLDRGELNHMEEK